MRRSTLGWCAAILAIIVIVPAQAQERSRQAVQDGPAANTSSRASEGGSTPANSGAGSQGMSSSGTTGSTSGRTGGGDSAQSQPVSNFPQMPKLSGTSFGSSSTYARWENYSNYLMNRFMMNPYYFNRFYRNVEPLITPELLKISTTEPLKASTTMLSSINELQAMIAALNAGKPVSRKEITAKTQAIRKLAEKIRKDQSLAFIDQRRKIDILKRKPAQSLGLDAISQLCEIAADLHSQLTGLNRQTSTSTISVHTLTQPSIESLSSGIEKLAKAIEDSAKRI
jgi:hypothetical protein